MVSATTRAQTGRETSLCRLCGPHERPGRNTEARTADSHAAPSPMTPPPRVYTRSEVTSLVRGCPVEIPRFGWSCDEPWLRGEIANVPEGSVSCLLSRAASLEVLRPPLSQAQQRPKQVGPEDLSLAASRRFGAQASWEHLGKQFDADCVVEMSEWSDFPNENWRRRPDLNRGWRFCRQGQVVYVLTRLAFWSALFSLLPGVRALVFPNCSHVSSLS